MMLVSINLVCHFKEGSSSLICKFTAIWLLSAGFFDARGGPKFSFEGVEGGYNVIFYYSVVLGRRGRGVTV